MSLLARDYETQLNQLALKIRQYNACLEKGLFVGNEKEVALQEQSNLRKQYFGIEAHSQKLK